MAAEQVRRQYRHGKQEIEELENGICLSLPVRDDREILMKIFQYGANARVLAPESLRKRVTKEINHMTKNYTP